MTPQSIMDLAKTYNVDVFITPAGKIKIEGDQHFVEELLPYVKSHRSEIMAFLSTPTIEPDLKPCPLCNGRDFTQGHRGGFFCSVCQPNVRPGSLVRAGGNRTVVETIIH